jgi:methyl-accepting chemotaxis protein
MSKSFFPTTIRAKLIWAFGLILCCTIGLGLFAVARLSEVQAVGAEMRNDWLPSTRALGIVAQSVERLRANYALIVIAATDESRAYYTTAAKKSVAELEDGLKSYAPLVSSGEERQIADKVTNSWQVFRASAIQFETAMAAGDRAKGLELLTGDMSKSSIAFRTALQEDLTFNLHGGQDAADRGDALGRSAHLWILVVLGAMGLLCVAIGGALIRGISTPIFQMTGAMRQLSERNLAIAIPGVGRGDELGAMATAVQVFKDNMITADRLSSEQQVEQAAKEQKATRLEGLVKGFEAEVGDMVSLLAAGSAELEGTARSLSSTAAETTRQSAAVAAAVEETSSNVQTVASASEEMAASIGEISRQVTASAEIAGQAVEQADRSARSVAALAQAAQKIGEVVRIIQDIASQTNLLALNATIEAARAGEAGKGFAVVASEVKALANQTAQATQDIQTQVAEIQTATKETVADIGSVGGTIGDISETTTAIAAAIEQQGAATTEISRNVQQAATSTQEVARNISGVSVAAGETGTAAGHLLGSATKLSQQADRLRAQVASFANAVRAG